MIGPAMIQWGPKIETGNSSTPQLYDMRKDINERANIILQHPKVVYDMQNILRRVRNKNHKDGIIVSNKQNFYINVSSI